MSTEKPSGLPKVRIETKQLHARVYIDGNEVHGVQRIEFARDVNHDLPLLRIDLFADELTIDDMCLPELPELYKSWYVRKEEIAQAEKDAAPASEAQEQQGDSIGPKHGRVPEIQEIDSGDKTKAYLSQVLQVLGSATKTCKEENLGPIGEAAAKIGRVLVAN